MTSDLSSQPENQPIDAGKNQPGILCSRCDHLNYAGRDDCEDCGSPLFVDCGHCGQRAPRVYTRCPRCRHRLHGRGGRSRKHRGHGHQSVTTLRKATRQLLWAIGIGLAVLGIAGLILMQLRG